MSDDEDAGPAAADLEAGEMRREPPSDPSPSSVPLLTIKVAHGLRQHEITIPSEATFGDLKFILAPLTDVHPHEQRLMFKGKQKDDNDHLHTVGVKNKSKILLIEDLASKERKWEESRKNERIAKACQAVAHIRGEVDKLAAQVTSLESTVESGNKVAGNEFALLSELLMRQLLKLDGIGAEGEAKVQRKSEVQRVQRFADVVDRLKAQNNDPLYCSNAVKSSSDTRDTSNSTSATSSAATTNWEHFD